MVSWFFLVGVVGVVEMVRLVEVNRVVEVVYRHEKNLGVTTRTRTRTLASL